MKYLLTKWNSEPRLLRWIFLLQEFDLKDSWLEKRRLNVMVRLWNNFEFNPGKLKLKWISLSMIKEPFEPYFDGEVDQQAWQFIKRNKISLIKRRRVYDVKQTLAGRQPSFVSQILHLSLCTLWLLVFTFDFWIWLNFSCF